MGQSIAMLYPTHAKQLSITRNGVADEGFSCSDNFLPAQSLTVIDPRHILMPRCALEASKQPAVSPKLVRFGIYQVDVRTSELWKQGRKIKLQEQPCRILAILLEQRGEVVTREELRKRLWSDDTFVDFDHSLNTAIMRLREALNDSSDNPRFIETLPRHGYRFIASIEELDGSAPEGAEESRSSATREVASQASEPGPAIPFPAGRAGADVGPRRIASRLALILGSLLALLVIALIGVRMRLDRNGLGANSQSDQIKSLVVLPFENLSGDKEQQYFTDGMTDELIAHLAKIRSLRVISRTSSMEYKDTHKPLSQIARDLKVDAVVEGTVLRSGDRVRITAELVQVATDRHLWAETYESQLGDVLGLQSRVASAIVNEIRVSLTPEEQKRLSSSRSVSSESYENYLKGRYYWNKRSQEGLTKAIDYFQLAIEKDPNYALAYAGLADCYSIIGSAIVGTVPSQEVAPKAKAAAMKALQLDDTLAEAQTSLATVRFNYDWDWAGAADGFRRSIELNPSYATAYQRYSLYLMAMGRTTESLAQMTRARELEPLSISMNFSLGWRLYMARKYDEAIEQLQNTLDMDPNFALPRMVLGQAYEQKNAYPKAVAELQQAVAISRDSPQVVSALGHTYGASGNRSEAEKALAHLMEQAKKEYVSPFYVALVYAGMGENDKAIDWLEKAYSDRSNAIVFSKVDPQLDPLRSHPRFQSLLQRLALEN